MIGYKLTTQDGYTRKGAYNETFWKIGTTHTALGEGNLCTSGWIHFYPSPLIALLMNPCDANITNPRLWKVKAKGIIKEEPLKCGCSELMILERMKKPRITKEQRIKFAILCAKEVCECERWNKWSDSWLSGEDRTKKSAVVVADVYANFAANYAAAYAADAAAYYAASAHYVADAAHYAAFYAAFYAANAKKNIDFIKIAQKSCTK